MQETESLSPMTLEEFDAMEKDELLNYEPIDGEVVISPCPSREHQQVSGNLAYTLYNQPSTTNCEALYGLDVTAKGNLYHPDLVVFCEEESDDETNNDFPIIIFEILSSSSQRMDLFTKVFKYMDTTLSEYWIIDPKTKSITVHYFFNETSDTYGLGDIAVSLIRPEIQIALTNIFV